MPGPWSPPGRCSRRSGRSAAAGRRAQRRRRAGRPGQPRTAPPGTRPGGPRPHRRAMASAPRRGCSAPRRCARLAAATRRTSFVLVAGQRQAVAVHTLTAGHVDQHHRRVAAGGRGHRLLDQVSGGCQPSLSVGPIPSGGMLIVGPGSKSISSDAGTPASARPLLAWGRRDPRRTVRSPGADHDRLPVQPNGGPPAEGEAEPMGTRYLAGEQCAPAPRPTARGIVLIRRGRSPARSRTRCGRPERRTPPRRRWPEPSGRVNARP